MTTMKNFITCFIFFCFFIGKGGFSQGRINSGANSPGKSFSFTLKNAGKTSAGIFKSDGTLIKTLWSGVSYNAGTYSKNWDGTDDAGKPAADDKYQVKVLSNNIQYQWEGTAGNTSTDMTGENILHGQRIIYGVCVSGTRMYVAHNYNEKLASYHYIDLSDIGKEYHFFKNFEGAYVRYIATDGIRIYWGGGDANSSKTFLFSTKASDNTEAAGTNSVPTSTTYGRTYISGFNVVTGPNKADKTAQITGVAVQRTGNYLFVTRKLLNKVYVLNKTTYALVQTITNINAPAEVATDAAGNLWMIHNNNIIEKYTVSGSGGLTSSGITLSGIADPYALAVSPTTGELAVCDGGTSQQVKFFNGSTGALNSTLGQAGGYVNSPAVTDYKFAFSTQRDVRFTADDNYGGNFASITFQPDGSFWVVDIHNSRVQHYNSSKVYVERMMMLSNNSQCVDKTNPTRVFRGYLEFNIDYNNPNYRTSWRLVNNWSGNALKTYGELNDVVTMSNGKTYGWQLCDNNQNRELVELTATGIRYTGLKKSGQFWQIDKDDYLINWNSAGTGKVLTYTKYALASFNGSNNPVWSSTGTIFAQAAIASGDPQQEFHNKYAVTSSGIVAIFTGYKGSAGYHLGGIPVNGTGFSFKTSKSTSSSYTGAYPLDGTFDIGNNVGNAGSQGLTAGRSIMWCYYGEGWKGGFQVNQYAHYWDDGLLLNVFGTNWTLNPNGTDGQQGGPVYIPFAGMAGNAYHPSLIVNPNDTASLFLYHNDESYHNGIHRWKVTGLNTIQEQVIPLFQTTLSSASALSFGSIAVNSESNKTLTVTNSASNQDIVISSIAINGSTSFSYTAPYSLPFTLKSGKSADLSVKFKPSSAADQTANLVVNPSDPTNSTTTALSGTGTSTGNNQQSIGFTLVNANTDQDIQTLKDGDTINPAVLSGKNLNIRANTSDAVGSLVFNLSNQETRTQTETGLPLALFGDVNGHYNTWTPTAGRYTLKATPYSQSRGNGTAGTPVTINFTVIDGSGNTSSITSFTLVNATTDQDIQTLNNGDSIDLSAVSGTNLNIRANNSSGVGSEVFNLTGQETRTQTETSLPLAVFGDINGNYSNWTPAVGSYNLKATPYSQSGGNGTAGTSFSIEFNVINQASVSVQQKSFQTEAKTPEEQVNTVKVYPNPSDKGRFTVLLPSKFMGDISFSLVSVSGNKLTSGTISLKKPASHLSFDFFNEMTGSGIYYLILETNKQKTYIKLMRR